MDYEIIDFHTHPFLGPASNICGYPGGGMEESVSYLKGMGISRICGSVICKTGEDMSPWETIQECNRLALVLRERYGDFYVPGFHVHPDYVTESCEEIEKKMAWIRENGFLGVKIHPDYQGTFITDEGYLKILHCAKEHDLIVVTHAGVDAGC